LVSYWKKMMLALLLMLQGALAVELVSYQLKTTIKIVMDSYDDGSHHEPYGSYSLDVGTIGENQGIEVWSCDRDKCHSNGLTVTKTKEILEAPDFLDTNQINYFTLHGHVKEADSGNADDLVGEFGGETVLAHQTAKGTTLTFVGENDGDDYVEIYLKLERIDASRSLDRPDEDPDACIDDNAGLSELMYMEYTCAMALEDYPPGICDNDLFNPYCCASCTAADSGVAVQSLAKVNMVSYQLKVTFKIILTTGDDGGSYEPYGSFSLDVGGNTGRNQDIDIWDCARDKCHSTGLTVTSTKEILEADDFLDTNKINYITLHGYVKEADSLNADDNIGNYEGETVLAHQTTSGTTLTFAGPVDKGKQDKVEIYLKLERIDQSSRSLGAPVPEPCHDEDGHPISGDPFEYAGDCKKFYQCSNGILTTHDCPKKTVFNPDVKVCDFPKNVDSCGNSDIEIFTGQSCTGTSQSVAVSGDGANLCFVGIFNDGVASIKSAFNGVVDLRKDCYAGSELLQTLVVSPGVCIDLTPEITSVISVINKAQSVAKYHDELAGVTENTCGILSRQQCRRKRAQCKYSRNDKRCHLKACGDVKNRLACKGREDCQYYRKGRSCHDKREQRQSDLDCNEPISAENQDLCDLCAELCASGNGSLACNCHDHIVG